MSPRPLSQLFLACIFACAIFASGAWAKPIDSFGTNVNKDLFNKDTGGDLGPVISNPTGSPTGGGGLPPVTGSRISGTVYLVNCEPKSASEVVVTVNGARATVSSE